MLRSVRLLVLRAGLVGVALTGGVSFADGPDSFAQGNAEIQALWSDPKFLKSFVAGYGIDAEVEPRVLPDEVKLLEKIRPLMSENKLAEAEAALKKGMKKEWSAALDFTLGQIQFQQQRIDEALANFKVAVEKFPSFRRAWRNIGLIAVRNGANDEAIESFTKMIKLGGADSYAYGLLGFAYASKLDFQAAEAAYRNALLLDPSELEWRLGLTRCVFRQQKFEDAAALLDVLLERNPEKAEFWLLQAHSYLGMKQPLRAAENLEALDLLGKSTVDSLHTLGDIYLSEGLADLAVRAYERGVALSPDQPAPRPIKAAEILAAKGFVTQSKALVAGIRASLDARLDDTDRRRLLKLEARIAMAGGDASEETATILEEIVKLDPLDGEALMLLGQHYAKAEKPDRAIFYFERAEKIEAFEAPALLRHAQTLAAMGRYADAVPLLRRAQELKPRDDVARYLDQIDRLAKTKR
ncbi:MAG: tetratricopeptide repeat protein [Phycisphaerae bacterium]|nr:tetratricopeptide repeat protein [Phycisphaerae bacterium]